MFGWLKKKAVAATGDSLCDVVNVPLSQHKLTLIDVLKKNNKTELGLFEDLNRDLGNYIEKNYETCDPMIKMAYAYARRLAVTGLYFQGIVGQNVVNHVQDIFGGLQSLTGQTIAFQEEASNQATEVLKSYVPRLTNKHEKALIYFARQGMTAIDLAVSHGYFAIDEIEDDPVTIDKCLDLIEHVIRTDDTARLLFDPGQKLVTRPRLIDLVDKTSSSGLGAFGNMCEDIKASAHKYVGDNMLWAASGYAYLLGACAVYVGGGVHPKLIQDACEMSDTMIADLDGNQAALDLCKEQAVALAMTYATRMTSEAAKVIIELGLKFERLANDGEVRLSPDEVVLRARRMARDRDFQS